MALNHPANFRVFDIFDPTNDFGRDGLKPKVLADALLCSHSQPKKYKKKISCIIRSDCYVSFFTNNPEILKLH